MQDRGNHIKSGAIPDLLPGLKTLLRRFGTKFETYSPILAERFAF